MSKNIRIVGLAIIGLVVGLVAVFLLTRADAPDAFELSSDDTDNAAGTDSAESGEATEPTVVDSIDGSWTIDSGSQAGYRVVEDFAGGLQDFEAVGRGSDIEGSITIEGTTISVASFEVQIATITSDDDLRDSKFRGDIMSADEFPTAKFVLTEPIELGTSPESGTPVSTTAMGDLTLRGVTNSVPVTIDAQLTGGRIEIVGSIDVLFSDYSITNPSIERIISVRDEGKVEFQLFLTN